MDILLSILAIPFLILILCIYAFIAGIAGFVWFQVFGIDTFTWDLGDDQNDYNLDYLVQWRFWVNFFVGTLHCYLFYLIQEINFFWAFLWALSPLGLLYLKTNFFDS